MSDEVLPVRRATIFVSLTLIFIVPLLASLEIARLSAAHAHPALAGADLLRRQLIGEGLAWAYAFLMLAIALFWERRPLSNIGLRWPDRDSVKYGLGGAAAMLAASLFGTYLWILLVPGGLEALKQIGKPPELELHGSVLLALYFAVRAGFVEELLFRGIAIAQLTSLTGDRIFAGIASGVFFVLLHVPQYGWIKLVSLIPGTIVLTGLYLWRRDLMTNIITHFVVDALALVAVALLPHRALQ